MVRNKSQSRSRKRKSEPQRRPSKKKQKYDVTNKPAYMKEREARAKENELPKKYNPPLIQKKENWKNLRAASSEEEEEEDPLKVLLGTFENKKLPKATVLSDSESEENSENDSEDIENLEEENDSENETSLGENYGDFKSSEEEVDDDDGDDDDVDNDNDNYKETEEVEEENEEVDDENEEVEEDDDDENEEVDEDDDENEEVDEDDDENEEVDEDDDENEEVEGNMETEDEKESENSDPNESDEEKDNKILQNQEEEDADPKEESSDPFTLHLQNDITDDLYKSLSTTPNYKSHNFSWSKLGKILCQIPESETAKAATNQNTILSEEIEYAKPGTPPRLISTLNWKSLYVKPQIHVNISKVNYENINNAGGTLKSPLTPLQTELFSLINNYQDLLYPERTFSNAEEIRLVYCLHAMNHVLKTRMKIMRHNLKLSKSRCHEVPDEFRDQGLVRPKVLIVVPFRDSCLKIVKMLIGLLIDDEKGGSVINKKRFLEEYSGGEIVMPKKNPKPEDYELTFKGNSDDSFRIGIQVTKKVLKLYSDFYSSDIIVASPLGLRTLIGAEGEADRDYDYLASIELMILDQAEIFLMQNWDHFIHLMDHMHLQPKTSRGTDFSRIRSWAVNGWTKYYRQTLIFSSFEVPEIHGIFAKRCQNYAGRNKICNAVFPGSASQVVVQIPQVYHRFEATSYSQAIDARFNFFISKILPQYTDSVMNHTLIFVPSYFDYVKLRNYLKEEQLNFVQICEYSKDSKIAKARDIFFHSESQFLLYSERFHFFRRIRMKGIRHILFYAIPVFSHFYSEMINLMQESNQNPKGGSESNMSVTVVYCKFDIMQLSSVIGTERARKMLTSEKNVHMIITDK